MDLYTYTYSNSLTFFHTTVSQLRTYVPPEGWPVLIGPSWGLHGKEPYETGEVKFQLQQL